jgi:hypothetical protein
MSKKKPSIVFCHGIWADGSCFNKVIPALQADGHDVIAVQYGLDTFAEDVATVKRTLGRVSKGHSRPNVLKQELACARRDRAADQCSTSG